MPAMMLNLLNRLRQQRPPVAPVLCERCQEQPPARHRVRTDLLDMIVCDAYADAARRLRLPVTG